MPLWLPEPPGYTERADQVAVSPIENNRALCQNAIMFPSSERIVVSNIILILQSTATCNDGGWRSPFACRRRRQVSSCNTPGPFITSIIAVLFAVTVPSFRHTLSVVTRELVVSTLCSKKIEIGAWFVTVWVCVRVEWPSLGPSYRLREWRYGSTGRSPAAECPTKHSRVMTATTDTKRGTWKGTMSVYQSVLVDVYTCERNEAPPPVRSRM